ncbi:MAG TPA: hypothetical protein VOA41_12325 [Candidatus Dormibacteraeota bacterium]|nr:hypothetical protein [Candidatus Dormibacteraeota bacterium]
MRYRKMLTIAIAAAMLVWAAPSVLAQVTPAAKDSPQAPAKAAAKGDSKPASAAPAPVKKAAAPAAPSAATTPPGKTSPAPGNNAKTDASTKTGSLAVKQPVGDAAKASSTAKVPAPAPAKAPSLTSVKEVQKTPAASPTTPKPTPVAAKTPAKTPAAKGPAKSSAKSGAMISAKQQPPKIARRDPFESLVGRQKEGGDTGPKLPGKAGLVISTLRLDGLVRAPNTMIAVVSNPQQRTYFLREGDQLYDGRVEKISMDGISFHENGKDAFGKPVERQVNKRIYPSSGEQQ